MVILGSLGWLSSDTVPLSLVVRYVNHDRLLVLEDLVAFIECDTGISGHAIADKIISCIQA